MVQLTVNSVIILSELLKGTFLFILGIHHALERPNDLPDEIFLNFPGRISGEHLKVFPSRLFVTFPLNFYLQVAFINAAAYNSINSIPIFALFRLLSLRLAALFL
jgi:hypothetical protein